MFRSFVLFLAVATFWGADSTSFAQENAVPNGELVATLNADEFVANAPKSSFGQIQRGADDSKSNAETLNCIVSEIPQNPWNLQLRVGVDRPVAEGEVLLLSFRARTIDAKTESGLGVVGPFFETANQPYRKSLERRIEIGRERREYSIPFRCVESRNAGESAFGFFLGYRLQTVEISNVRLESFGVDFDLSTLPDSTSRYSGQEADAPWRRAAEERIERIRKGDLTIRTLDASGTPVSGVDVEIRQTRSAFGWGTAVVARRLSETSADADRYREFIATYCNVVVFENDLKWFGWQNKQNRADVFRALNWLDAREIAVRGHCLVWPSWRNSTPDWKNLANAPEKLGSAVREHILDETTALRGRVVDWDVVNEIHDNNDILRILDGGNREKDVDVLADWFRIARDGDPNARLFLNDYGILSGEGLDVRKQNSYFETIRQLQATGAPIGGIGLQGHFGQTATPPEKIVEILDRFGQTGLPLAVTEHDVDSADERYQAEFTRDFLTAAFSSPAVDKILVWGFWAKSHWRPNSAYCRADWTLTPAGRVWTELVGQKWRSNIDAATDEKGQVDRRVFLGDYKIVARRGTETQTVEASVSKDGANVDIRFER